MHRLILLLAILALAVGTTVAQAASSISGRVVNAEGQGVPQAVVFLNDPGSATAASGASAEMDQINKTFVPGVLPVVVGTRVHFPNRDQIHHHVYSFSRTKTFELPLYKGEDAPPVLFDKVGVVKVGCNIHDWMSGIILVLPNAHYAVTDAEGRFTLSGVPGGSHALAAWHAQHRGKLDDTTQRVELGDGLLEVNFTLPLDAASGRPAVSGARKEP
ncbi:MAG TPA: carboxypeptidase regulatory-like domain-containing protein [Steroidobacteraceae bacterium]|nr:carboxypeptidase regulatory-like domain-containing protein [Steroidobacteraceae bacterium]